MGEMSETDSATEHGWPSAATIAKLLLGIVIVFVAAELIVRQIAPDLPWQLRLHTSSAQVKFDQIQEIRDEGETRDVVFGGSSIADNGFNPGQFSDLTGESSFNAAVEGAGILVNGPWMVDVVIPELDPKVLVIGINTLDFNAGISYGWVVRSYRRAWYTKEGTLADIERSLGEHSELVWERPLLRNVNRYDEIWKGVFGDHLTIDEVELQARNYGPDGDKRLVFQTGGLPDEEIKTRYFADFDFDIGMFEDWQPLIDDAEQRGIDLVIVNMPVQQGFKDLHPGGEATYDDEVAQMKAGFEQRGADWIDASAWVSDPAEFTDLHHLNTQGAQKLTDQLAKTLLEQGVVS